MMMRQPRDGTRRRRVCSHPAPKRKSYRAARAFFLTLTIALLLAAYAYAVSSTPSHGQHSGESLLRREVEVDPLRSEDEKCRLVHQKSSSKQCAFVRKHCPADEPGFSAYLDLYYCRLEHAKPLGFSILIAWLGLLFSTIGIAASDFFCINLSTIAAILGMSESMAGVTFLAFGNGSPDLFSTFAAMTTNSGSLAIGELIGAAGFITTVVAGSMALIRPFRVSRKAFVRDVGFFVVAAAFSMVFLSDGKLRLWECLVMVAYYCFYVAVVVAWHWWLGKKRRRREQELAARGQYAQPGDELETEDEGYHDDPEEAPRPALSRGASADDFSALERNAGTGQSTPYGHQSSDEDEEEEERDRWIADLNSNMRLSRPVAGNRRNTVTRVRPSLVGALEFQSVLSSLQKSRNLQTYPLHSRRFSDEPAFTTAQQQDQMSTHSDPAERPSYEQTQTSPSLPTTPTLSVPNSAPARIRAVSANDATGLRIDQDLVRRGQAARSASADPSTNREHRPQPSLLDVPAAESEGEGNRSTKGPTLSLLPPSPMLGPAPELLEPQRPSPSGRGHLAVPEPFPDFGSLDDQQVTPTSPAGMRLQPPSPGQQTPTSAVGVRLHPPSPGLQIPTTLDGTRLFPSSPNSQTPSSPVGMRLHPSPPGSPSEVPRSRTLPRIVIPRDRSRASSRSSGSGSPYLSAHPYQPSPLLERPPSLYLPAAMASPESLPTIQQRDEGGPRSSKPIRWWPYNVLPAPGDLMSTLFPTIYNFNEKTVWEKLLGIVAAPSVFLLTITLPVVEKDEDDGEEAEQEQVGTSYDSVPAKGAPLRPQRTQSTTDVKGPVESIHYQPGSHHHASLANLGPHRVGGSAGVAMNTEQTERHNYGSRAHSQRTKSANSSVPSITLDTDNLHEAASLLPAETLRRTNSAPGGIDNASPQPWNRWLTLIHLYTGPLFILLSIYSQLDPTDTKPSWLLIPSLICLLISTLLLIPFLLTTTPTHRPSYYRTILSLAGFLVSIAWISTIAAQVVGALKALAVVLNISHAIMGLTIFAVGNSLGDLVADITVARLGYPVMALSACFGGPMLNILLGVGLSGSYLLISGHAHRQHKHPHQEVGFKAYPIEVEKTLVVSGVTLLVTLVGCLVVVPLNRWVLSKKIGWCLIAVWVVSTIGNVALELSGVSGHSGD
ncbi:hypothetical protein MBLNU230_g5995t1 [Neophaeotheca triangularis]